MTGRTRDRLVRARTTLVVWSTAVAIAGTLGACGRYGPPQRRPPQPLEPPVEAPAVELPDVGVAAPSDDEPSDDE